MNKPNTLLTIGLILLLISTISAGGYWIYSNTIQVTVSQITISLSTNATSCDVGDIIRLTVTLNQPLSDIIISFYENAVWIGNSTTINGIAVFDRLMSTSGTFAFNASCFIP